MGTEAADPRDGGRLKDIRAFDASPLAPPGVPLIHLFASRSGASP
jgi:hypothetical protein